VSERPFQLGLLVLGRRSASRTVEIARAAELAGFDIFWIPDERFFREVYSLCTLVAGATGHILVGPCVTDPYTRHPALTAMAIATLDELSGGRAVLGLGAGVSGFSELRLARPRPALAVAETIALVRDLLTGDEVSFSGEVLAFEGKLDFNPPRADIPMYVAAGGPRMLAMAGALADGVIIEGCISLAVLDAAMEHIQGGAGDAGRDPARIDIVARIDTAVDTSLEQAYEVLRPRIARHLAGAAPGFERFTARGIELPERLKALAAGVGYTHDAHRLAPIAAEVTPELIDAFCIAATPETLGERIAPLLDRGVTQLIVNPVAPDDRVEPILAAVAAWRRSAIAGTSG
jgi:5,10-methylenetetrahydromethanopterin reductase